MKLFKLTIFFFVSFSFGQTQKKIINLNSDAKTITQTLDEGNYILEMRGTFECNNYYINYSIDKRYIEEKPISTSIVGKKDCPYAIDDSFVLESNTEVEVNIKIIAIDGDKEIKTLTRIYTTIKTRKWMTSFGISGVKLVKADTYRTIPDGDKFKINKGGSQEQYKAIPVMMFSVINLKNEKAWIPSGGFGIDLENVTAFVGISKAFAQNFIITGGLAMHKQLRLDGEYKENQIVDQAIPFNDLNSDYYRVNPFISITFHLNNNIFKK